MEREPIALVQYGCRWVRANPERWGELLDLLEWAFDHHPHDRIRRGDVFNYAQRRGMSVTLRDQFRFDNSLWSVLSRYAIMCRPWLVRAIRPRASGIDSIDLATTWLREGLDPSCFEVGEWREAEVLYRCRPAS